MARFGRNQPHQPIFLRGPTGGPVVPDTWAPSAQSFVVHQPYTPPRARAIMQPDASTNTFADWTPEPMVSRQVPRYQAPLSRTFMQPDASTNTFADWAPEPVVNTTRPLAYKPPTQIVSYIAGAGVTPDTVALPTTLASSPTRLYTAPRSRASWIVDPALNTFADWVPPILVSRRVGPYAPQRSSTILTSDQAPVFGTEMAFITQSPRKLGREPGTSWTRFYTDVQTIIVITAIPIYQLATLGGNQAFTTSGGAEALATTGGTEGLSTTGGAPGLTTTDGTPTITTQGPTG